VDGGWGGGRGGVGGVGRGGEGYVEGGGGGRGGGMLGVEGLYCRWGCSIRLVYRSICRGATRFRFCYVISMKCQNGGR
jgi:hypothetical protein